MSTPLVLYLNKGVILCYETIINHLCLYYISVCLFSFQVICSGAVVAAGFTLAKYLEIQNYQLIDLINATIDSFSPDVRKMIQAVVAVAIVSGVFIPLEIVVILLRLLGISLGKLGRVIVILVIY